MESHFTQDIFAADVIVDLSNVLRTKGANGSDKADPIRLDRVVSALQRYEREENVVLYGVADASLFSRRLYATTDTHRRVRAWRDDHLVEVHGDADPCILELAEASQARVLSGDRFKPWRRMFPWLQGNTDQFIEAVQLGGQWTIRPVDLGVLPSEEQSRSEEEDQFKRHGLVQGRNNTPRHEVIQRLWSCPHPNPVCRVYDGTAGFVFLPLLVDGVVTCAYHGHPLTDAGPRPSVVQLKLMVDGEREQRFTLNDGDEVTVGRAPGDGAVVDLSHWLPDEVVRQQLSRQHVRLRLAGGALHARDLSSYGTDVRIPARDGRPAEMVRLPPATERRIRAGEALVLTDRVELRRSGRRFPNELPDERRGPQRPSVGADAPTTPWSPPTPRSPADEPDTEP